MKSISTILVALLLAVCAIPLRGLAGIDAQRAPINRWLWLRSEIAAAEPRRIDFAFTGSSKTLSAVRPSVVSDLVPGAVAFNFAHFAWGHDADYFVAKPLLERHEVGTLIVEIPPGFPIEVHDQTRHLVGVQELGDELFAAASELRLGDLLAYSAALKSRVDRLATFFGTVLLSLPKQVLIHDRLQP